MTSTTKVAATIQSSTAEPSNEDGSLHTNIIIIGACILGAVAIGALLYVAVLVYQRIKRNKRALQPQRRNGVDDDRSSEEGVGTELMGMSARPGTVSAVDERIRHNGALFGCNHTLPRDRGRGAPSLPPGDVGELRTLLDCPHARCDPPVTTSGLTNMTRYPLEGSSCAEHQEIIASRPSATVGRWTPAVAASGVSSGPENGGVDQIVKALTSDPQLHAMLLRIVELSANLLHAPPQSSRGAAAAVAPCCDSHCREVPAVHDDSSVTRPKHAAVVERTALGHGCPDDYVLAHSGRQPHDVEPLGMAAVMSGAAAAASSAPEAATSAVAAARSGEAVAAAATAELAELHASAAGHLTNGLVVTAGGAAVRSPAPEVSVHDAHSVHNRAINAAFGRQSPPMAATVTGAAVATTAPLVGPENLGGAAALADRRSEGTASGAGWSPGTTASDVAIGRDAAAAAAAASMIADAHRQGGSRQRGVSCSAVPHGGCCEHHMSVLKTSDCHVDSSRSSGCRERGRQNFSLHISDIGSCRVSGSVQP